KALKSPPQGAAPACVAKNKVARTKPIDRNRMRLLIMNDFAARVTIFAPAWAKASAMPRPIPLAAPVTTNIFSGSPSQSAINSSVLGGRVPAGRLRSPGHYIQRTKTDGKNQPDQPRRHSQAIRQLLPRGHRRGRAEARVLRRAGSGRPGRQGAAPG